MNASLASRHERWAGVASAARGLARADADWVCVATDVEGAVERLVARLEAIVLTAPGEGSDFVPAADCAKAARSMLCCAATQGWSAVMGCLFDLLPEWWSHCQVAIESIYAAHPSACDLGARVARSLIDRAIALGEGERRCDLLSKASESCAWDLSSGRTRGLASGQLARVWLLNGDREKACACVEAAYKVNPEFRDGYTHLAWIELAGGRRPAALRLTKLERAAGRATKLSQREAAVLDALGGDWSSTDCREPDTAIAVAIAVVDSIAVVWPGAGLSRVVRERLLECRSRLERQNCAWHDDRHEEIVGKLRVMLDDGARPADSGLLDDLALAIRAKVGRWAVRSRAFAEAAECFRGLGDRIEVLDAGTTAAVCFSLWEVQRDDEARALAAQWVRAGGGEVDLDFELGRLALAELESRWRMVRGRGDDAFQERAGQCVAWLEAGQARSKRGTELAVAAFLSGVDGRTAPDAAVRIGCLLQDVGRIREADTWFRRAEVDGYVLPGWVRLRQAVGVAWQGRWGCALESATELAAADPAHKHARSLLAERVLRASVEQRFSGGDPTVLEDHAKDCLTVCREEAAGTRATAATFATAAACAVSLGLSDEASIWFERAYDFDPLAMDVRFRAGSIPGRAGDAATWTRLAEADFADGRLSALRTREWLVQAAYTRGSEARRLAAIESPRIICRPETLRSQLYSRDPYEGLEFQDRPEKRAGWHSESPVFGEVVSAVRPRSIFEVGSWLGGSAIEMARRCAEAGLSTRILCIDTWLGAAEFWLDRSDARRYAGLGLSHGYPTVHRDFLVNCAKAGFADRITPFPQTGAGAALWLAVKGYRADLAYIDGSHVYEDVLGDMRLYWPLVRDGGVLFGDDFAMPDVAAAVREFFGAVALPFEVRHGCWLAVKPRRAGSA
ncbi:hypothetical protein ASA1KI_09330 [Opitutales bacterium ASA1]|uniref:class I SAM-dependent methyltransferase n=1 Tax=Congregicoccus parvus TaxID=3081749 RepID=UPI002B2ADC23|nr:hypothetical protein ASA1KI_09330 [Opitutales bacterium ASA1]